MTDEEVARFALTLSEADRIRAQIADDEAARTAGGYEFPLLVAPPAVEHTPASAAVAAA
jgi:hypothetical protein